MPIRRIAHAIPALCISEGGLRVTVRTRGFRHSCERPLREAPPLSREIARRRSCAASLKQSVGRLRIFEVGARPNVGRLPDFARHPDAEDAGIE